MSDCPSCGTPQARPEQRFCAKCGTNLAAVEPPAAYGQPSRITGPLFADDLPPPPQAPPTYAVPSYPPAGPPPYPPAGPPAYPPAGRPPPPGQPPAPSPYDNRSSRRRTSIVLLVAAALVAALIGAAGVVLLFAGDDDNKPDTAATDGANPRPTKHTGGTSSPTASPTESETGEPRAFRCWDGGAPVSRPGECSPPFGAAGLAWVFPSSTGSTCSASVGAERASETECTPDVGGAAVRFHYSEWRSRAALEAYYGGNTVASIAAPAGRDDLTALQVTSRESAVGYKVALYYADPSALWSVTIYAADESQYLSAVDQLDMRPFGQLRGKRA
jgi:hypothetical protein